MTRSRTVVAVGCALVVAELAVLAVAWIWAPSMTWRIAVDSFVITHGVAGAALLGCAGLLGWHRPANPIGWLFLAAAIGHTTAAMMPPLIVLGMSEAWPVPLIRTLTAVGVYAWPWTVTACVPVALILFPDGRTPGRGWRFALATALIVAPLFTLKGGLDPAGFWIPGAPPGFLSLNSFADLKGLWLVADLGALSVNLLAAAALVARYRRGDEVVRRQLLWLVLAAVLSTVVIAPFVLTRSGPILALLAINLVPISVTVAILRYRLLDIRLVVSRTLVYGLLTSGVVGVYVALVTLLDHVARQQVGLGSSLLATGVIAVLFNPVRVRLQRIVDMALYGDRSDPLRAVSRVGDRLTADAGAGLPGVLQVMAEALRLPYVALEGAEAACGPGKHGVPLHYNGIDIGTLVIGLRAGEHRLTPADLAVLRVLAGPLALAVHATTLSADLRRAQGRIVAAREEERRRLRRDLHDGLGPTLTGIYFQAEAVRNMHDPADAAVVALLTNIREQSMAAIDHIRHLIDELRPSELDSLGLVDALRQHAMHLTGRPGGPPLQVTVAGPPSLASIPAPVEIAAYRIGLEAITNAARHTLATRVDVIIDVVPDEVLTIQIHDNDTPSAIPWAEGTGLRSIRERAAEFGGTCTAGPDQQGGLVFARLPMTNDRQATATKEAR
ncbi:sensor histidine kinase [Streptosporangium vulgare]|uniref:histidine kinase n=1 Tax=Streptosporangium vulgare TaxID=46190 RepID=A0ABV5TTT4_9ACTN